MPTTLQIPSPCAQKWSDLMPVTSTCRSCTTCQRTVTDFTQKTDAEVLFYLQQNGRVCGRFRPDQLNRAFLGPRAGKRAGLTVIAAGLVTLLTAQQPVMQGEKAPMTNIDQISVPEEQLIPSTGSTPQDSFQTIAGKVVSVEHGEESAVGASVKLVGTQYGALTRLDGDFSFEVPKAILENDSLLLLVSYTGFETQTAILTDHSNLALTNFHFILTGSILGEVVISRPPSKNRLKRFFHRT